MAEIVRRSLVVAGRLVLDLSPEEAKLIRMCLESEVEACQQVVGRTTTPAVEVHMRKLAAILDRLPK